MTQVFASLLCSLFALLLFGSISPVSAQIDPYTISHVDIVFMNHLDIGFDGIDPTIGYAFNVINKYFDEYFPKAITTANEVRDLTVGLLHFVYTTHPYLVSLYLNCPTTWVYPSPGMAPNSSVPMKLHCPSASAVEAFKAAIMRGDIAWHAMPFNAEPEVVDDSMFTALLKMAKDLDKQFNKTSVMTMSQRDVPGMTRGVVPLLRKNGIEAITVGVNSASAPPAVPNLFVWKDVASNTDVIGMWHPGGYGGTDVSDCVTFPGFDRALAFAFRSDNKGPQNTLEALEVFASVQEEFPFARVNGATYDDFVQHVIPIKSKLPVITSEIGDTWIYGVPSDPLKVAQFREILRLRKSCLTSKQCDVNDQAFNLFDRLLMKVSEHTWGLDVKTFLDDFVNWGNPQFNKAKSVLPGYKLMTNSWLEQRSFITNAILQLKLDTKYRNFASQIESKLATLTPSGPPSVSGGWQKVASSNFNQIFSCGNFDLRFDATSGAIVGLLEKKTGIHWASPENQLAVYRMQSYNQDSYDRFFADYMYCSWEDCGDWAPKDFGKPNVSLAHVKEKTFTTTLNNIYTKTDSSGFHFRLEQTLPPLASQQVGGAQSVWVSIDIYPAGGPSKMDVTLYLIKKTPTRIPEAHWFTFAPVAKNSSDSWKFSKLGSLISPVDVVMNGSRHLHGIDDGGVMLDRKSSGKLTINSKDAAVVSYGLLSAFPTPLDARIPSANSGVHFSLYNNVWGTNYIMWYPYYPQDANIQYRFSLDFSS